MAYNLIWMDGFENYSLAQTSNNGDLTKLLDGLWIEASSGYINGAGARTGVYSVATQLFITLRRSLGGDFTRLGMQFGLYLGKLPTVANQGFVVGQFRDVNNNATIGLQIGTTGRVRVMLNGLDRNFGAAFTTLLAESTLEVAAGTWNHFEIKYFADASAGYVKVRVNGRDYVSATGINTIGVIPGTSTPCGDPAQIAFGFYDGTATYDFPSSPDIRIDDVAVGTWDDTDDGTFLGMYGVYYLKPNADTAVNDWGITSGPNAYAMVNEVAPDDDLNFLFTGTVDDKTALDVEALPADIVSVAAVMPIARSKKTDTGDGDLALGVISSTTEDVSTNTFALTADYNYYYDVWMLDPATAAQWDPTRMPSIEIKRSL